MYQPTKFIVLSGKYAGKTVYSYQGHDYGLARDDSMATGVEHTAVTYNPNGGTPFFTVPVRCLKEV